MVPDELQDILVRTPDTLSGAVRFRGTRVPVQALLDTLTHGLPVADFLEGFPDVTEAQAKPSSPGSRTAPERPSDSSQCRIVRSAVD